MSGINNMQKKIGILNIEAGNIFSVWKVFSQLNSNVQIINEINEKDEFSHLVLPGVASFGAAMKTVKKKNFDSYINKHLKLGKILLGLCVGCQILFNKSNEFGNHEGLNLLNGEVEKITEKKDIKLPNVGWFKLNINQKEKIFENISNDEFFYFTHSFHCIPFEESEIMCTYKLDGRDIVAGVRKKNIFGLQFHPEMSSSTGKKLLTNILDL